MSTIEVLRETLFILSQFSMFSVFPLCACVLVFLIILVIKWIILLEYVLWFSYIFLAFPPLPHLYTFLQSWPDQISGSPKSIFHSKNKISISCLTSASPFNGASILSGEPPYDTMHNLPIRLYSVLVLTLAKQTIRYVRHVHLALSVAKQTITQMRHSQIDLILAINETTTRALILAPIKQLDKNVKCSSSRL